MCISAAPGNWTCSRDADSLARALSVTQNGSSPDPLNILWIAKTFRDTIVFDGLMFVPSTPHPHRPPANCHLQIYLHRAHDHQPHPTDDLPAVVPKRERRWVRGRSSAFAGAFCVEDDAGSDFNRGNSRVGLSNLAARGDGNGVEYGRELGVWGGERRGGRGGYGVGMGGGVAGCRCDVRGFNYDFEYSESSGHRILMTWC